jgi:putative DNA methylase
MTWDHPEVNPFIKTSGSLENCIRDILRGLHLVIDFLTHQRDGVEKFREPQSIQIHNSSILSWQTDDKFKLIVTDPPYYDDVPYPEFLHILQVWYNRIIGDLVDIPPTPLTSQKAV